MTTSSTAVETHSTLCAQEPLGLNHVVLQVKDMEESHRFYTEILGFKHVGTSKYIDSHGAPSMRFYSGVNNGRLSHHDIGLIQAPATHGGSVHGLQSMHHLAFEYPSREAFYKQIDYLRSKGVQITRLIERGATHSADIIDPNGFELELVFELPREEWEADINGALNRSVRKALPE
jgi:catechol 2,3-dioxygenase